MTSIQRAGHSNWLLGTIAGIAVLALALTVIVGSKEIADNQRQQTAQHAQSVALELALDAQVQCIRKWAVETAASNALVRMATKTRNDALTADVFALDTLLRAAIRHRSPASLRVLSQRYLRAARAFQRADAAYKVALRKYPVLTPSLACKVSLKPIPVPTRTVTKTAPAPPVTTVTRRTPGPTVTRPGPTVTRTVTAPPGKGHQR